MVSTIINYFWRSAPPQPQPAPVENPPRKAIFCPALSEAASKLAAEPRNYDVNFLEEAINHNSAYYLDRPETEQQLKNAILWGETDKWNVFQLMSSWSVLRYLQNLQKSDRLPWYLRPCSQSIEELASQYAGDQIDHFQLSRRMIHLENHTYGKMEAVLLKFNQLASFFGFRKTETAFLKIQSLAAQIQKSDAFQNTYQNYRNLIDVIRTNRLAYLQKTIHDNLHLLPEVQQLVLIKSLGEDTARWESYADLSAHLETNLQPLKYRMAAMTLLHFMEQSFIKNQSGPFPTYVSRDMSRTYPGGWGCIFSFNSLEFTFLHSEGKTLLSEQTIQELKTALLQPEFKMGALSPRAQSLLCQINPYMQTVYFSDEFRNAYGKMTEVL